MDPQTPNAGNNKQESEQAWNEFYHAFEMRFRGSYEIIYERLGDRYGERLQNLAATLGTAFDRKPLAIDLGSGRGEFLRLMNERGFAARGCDSNPATSERQEENALVTTSDILAYLQRQESASIGLVSLLHVIEHCPPPYIFAVFKEVRRVLVPGGAFLVETPSLYSLWATGRQFYPDPTHERPVHPEYICFLGEHVGFGRVETLLFDEVVHPGRGDLARGENELGPETFATLRRWEEWFFGPMDAGFWMIN